MKQLLYFPRGIAYAYDKSGKKVNVERAYVYLPADCEDLDPCAKEVLRVQDPDAPNEWYEIDLVELAKSLTAPVVTKVTK